jgi:hypothetical protein
MAALVGRSECFEFSYSRLEEATSLFAQLADQSPDRGDGATT